MTIPSGYTALACGPRRALVRDDLVPVLGPWLLRAPLSPPPGATVLGGGRGATFRVALERGGAVIRFGRRGGIIGRFVREWYLDLSPRPWRELGASVIARRRGAPVPEVLAVGVHGWGVYRSVVVTDEIAGATTAFAALEAAAPGLARGAIAHAAGVAVARLHAAGVVHPDLNLTNVLVGREGATIVDLDRARVYAGAVAARTRLRSLRRLARSARKLDPVGAVVDAHVCSMFHAAYGEAARSDVCAP